MLSIGQLRAIARKFKAKKHLGLIVIDYLGKMALPKADRHDLAIGEIVTGCKRMAQELKTPVLLLVQMNRSGDRLKPRPQMTDLKDSSVIEAEADLIAFLHREGRLNDNYPQDLLEVIVRKSRHVPEAEKTYYLRMVDGGYQDVPDIDAIQQIEMTSQSQGGGF